MRRACRGWRCCHTHMQCSFSTRSSICLFSKPVPLSSAPLAATLVEGPRTDTLTLKGEGGGGRDPLSSKAPLLFPPTAHSHPQWSAVGARNECLKHTLPLRENSIQCAAPPSILPPSSSLFLPHSIAAIHSSAAAQPPSPSPANWLAPTHAAWHCDDGMQPSHPSHA